MLRNRSQQERDVVSFQNLSTVAIFFSGINASTIQYSYTIERSSLSVLINLFWFASLILSAASAIDSQFAIAWISSKYRSPTKHTPRVTKLAITQAPMVLLGFSACTFLFGLVFFAFHAFGGHSFLSLTISSIAGIMCTILLLIGLWQFGELYVGRRYSGVQQWLWPHLCGPHGPYHRILQYFQGYSLPVWLRRVSNLRLGLSTRSAITVTPMHPYLQGGSPSTTLQADISPHRVTMLATDGANLVYPKVTGHVTFSTTTHHSELIRGNELNDLMKHSPVVLTEPAPVALNSGTDPIFDLWDQLAPTLKLSFHCHYHYFVCVSPGGTRGVVAMGQKLLCLDVAAATKYGKVLQHPSGREWDLITYGMSRSGRYMMLGLGMITATPELWLWDTEVGAVVPSSYFVLTELIVL